jgi:hypothetical protein
MNLCLLGSWFNRFFITENKIWRKIIEYMYDTLPNVLWVNDNNASPFWKGIIWVAPSIRTGFRWQVGNGENVFFWLDTWISDHSLATMFWDLFQICNEQSVTIAEVMVGNEIRLTFHRCFNDTMMLRWYALCDLLSKISRSESLDKTIWRLEANGSYSVKSFYRWVNDGGVKVPNLAVIWKVQVPGRRPVTNQTCLFCSEVESVLHLFFDCVVSNLIWKILGCVFPGSHISSIDALSTAWLSGDPICNIVATAFLVSLWKTRNEMCFQGKKWSSMLVVWDRATSTLRRWRPIYKESRSRLLDMNLQLLDIKRAELLRIAWTA